MTWQQTEYTIPNAHHNEWTAVNFGGFQINVEIRFPQEEKKKSRKCFSVRCLVSKRSPLFFSDIFHNNRAYFILSLLHRDRFNPKPNAPETACPSGKFICIWVSFQRHLAPFIEYKACSLTVFRETLPPLLLPLLHHSPNHFPCKSRFVRRRCVSITLSAICLFFLNFLGEFVCLHCPFCFWIGKLLLCFIDRKFSDFSCSLLIWIYFIAANIVCVDSDLCLILL